MEKYYVNKQAQSNGDHEVHKAHCIFLPGVLHRLYLGEFTSCGTAVLAAKKTYPKADGCYHCSLNCHNS